VLEILSLLYLVKIDRALDTACKKSGTAFGVRKRRTDVTRVE
jgi:hypothetical protein